MGRNRTSSLHGDSVHPYIIAAKTKDRLNGETYQWTTSKIIRENPKNDKSKIVEIIIL
jgi:hypothetical protein